MEEIIMTKISYKQLKELISQCVKKCLQKHLIQPPPEDDTLLKIDAITKYLGVSKVTIHTWKKQGKIPFHRMGRKVYFKKSEILWKILPNSILGGLLGRLTSNLYLGSLLGSLLIWYLVDLLWIKFAGRSHLRIGLCSLFSCFNPHPLSFSKGIKPKCKSHDGRRTMGFDLTLYLYLV